MKFGTLAVHLLGQEFRYITGHEERSSAVYFNDITDIEIYL